MTTECSPANRTNPARPGPEPDVAARDGGAGGADARAISIRSSSRSWTTCARGSARVFQAPDGSFAFAVSGTGTSAMEAAVANLVAPGTRVLSVVTGYFGDRLAQMATRYGGDVTRVDAEWGRAIDPEQVRQALEGIRRRRRDDRARGNIDRRAESRSSRSPPSRASTARWSSSTR